MLRRLLGVFLPPSWSLFALAPGSAFLARHALALQPAPEGWLAAIPNQGAVVPAVAGGAFLAAGLLARRAERRKAPPAAPEEAAEPSPATREPTRDEAATRGLPGWARAMAVLLLAAAAAGVFYQSAPERVAALGTEVQRLAAPIAARMGLVPGVQKAPASASEAKLAEAAPAAPDPRLSRLYLNEVSRGETPPAWTFGPVETTAQRAGGATPAGGALAAALAQADRLVARLQVWLEGLDPAERSLASAILTGILGILTIIAGLRMLLGRKAGQAAGAPKAETRAPRRGFSLRRREPALSPREEARWQRLGREARAMAAPRRA